MSALPGSAAPRSTARPRPSATSVMPPTTRPAQISIEDAGAPLCSPNVASLRGFDVFAINGSGPLLPVTTNSREVARHVIHADISFDPRRRFVAGHVQRHYDAQRDSGGRRHSVALALGQDPSAALSGANHHADAGGARTRCRLRLAAGCRDYRP